MHLASYLFCTILYKAVEIYSRSFSPFYIPFYLRHPSISFESYLSSFFTVHVVTLYNYCLILQVFESLGLNARELTVDRLDVHAVSKEIYNFFLKAFFCSTTSVGCSMYIFLLIYLLLD